VKQEDRILPVVGWEAEGDKLSKGGANMALQDTFNGAKTAFTFYAAYLSTVAQEIGMERALALESKMLETLGTVQGKMIKDQAGAKDVDARAAYSLVKGILESLGLGLEVLEESPETVRFRCRQCSVYEGWQMAGLDDKTRETMCRGGSLRFMDAAVKQLDPKLAYQLVKYRSGPADFCEEQIVLA
jgi:hypothetical protein